MKNTTFATALFATALLFIPIYLVCSWVYTFNAFPEKTQAEKVAYFQSKFIPLTIDFAYLSVLGVIAAGFSIILVLRSSNTQTAGVKVYSYVLAALALASIIVLLGWMM